MGGPFIKGYIFDLIKGYIFDRDQNPIEVNGSTRYVKRR
jgi:hypothetical protein